MKKNVREGGAHERNLVEGVRTSGSSDALTIALRQERHKARPQRKQTIEPDSAPRTHHRSHRKKGRSRDINDDVERAYRNQSIVLDDIDNDGVDVQVADFDAATVAAMSPTGKAPVLVLPLGQTIFSSHAIARYIAGIRRDSGLTGTSLMEQGAIDAWMDFSATELELPACVWFYPPAGYMPFNKDA